MKITGREKITTYPTFISTIIFLIILSLAYLLDKPILVNFSFVVFFCGPTISVFLYVFYHLKFNKHPYIINQEEIKKLKETLETEKAKKIINALYHERRRNVKDIAWMLEKYLNIELHVKKGYFSGEIKSESLYKKIDEIIGVNTQHFWEERVRYTTTSNYILVICLLLSLILIIIDLLLFAFFPNLID